MRLISLFICAFALISFTAFADVSDVVVKKVEVDDKKAVIATVESVREVPARAQIGGTVTELSVQEGDRVKEGDKIAVIGDKKLAIKVEGMDARIQAAQSAYEKAKTDFERSKELRQSGYETQARLDAAQANFEIAAHNLEAAKSDKQEVSQQASEGVVLAPNNGRILKVPVSVGGVVMAGETIALLSQENYVLRLDVPERHARFLKAGDRVQIGNRALEGENADAPLREGVITLVYPEIKNGRVVADVAAKDVGDYFVGERTRVYVSTGKRAAIMLPKDMLYRRAGVDYVLLKSGVEVAVQKGQVLGNDVEVLAGLNEGDVVVKK